MFTNKIKTGVSLYRVFSRAYFHLPFMAIFLYKQGFSIFQIELIMAIYGFSVFTYTQIPESYNVINSSSSKSKLVIGEIFKIIGLGVIIFFNSDYTIYISQIFLGFGYGISAGEDTKIINKYFDDNGKVQAKSNSYMFISLLSAGLLGSVLFNIDIKLPFIASGLASLLAIISCLFFFKNLEKSEDKKIKTPKLKKLLNNIEIDVICIYAFTRGIILTFFTGFLPYHLFIDLKIPIYGFILILTSYTLAGNISSNIIAKKIKDTKVIRVVNVSLLISLIAFLSNNLFAIMFGVILLGLTSGVTRPMSFNKLRKINANIPYVSNIMEATYSIINITLLILGGYLYMKYSFEYLVLLLLLVYGIYTLLRKFLDIKYETGVEYNEN